VSREAERHRCRRPITLAEVAYLEAAGARLAEVRRAHGWTQAALARRVRVHVNTIASIERGVRRTRRRTLERIAERLVTPVLNRADPAVVARWARVDGAQAASELVEELVTLAGPALAPRSTFVFTPRRR
jgi:transcriptional regulator with XRE-family HTH domain